MSNLIDSVFPLIVKSAVTEYTSFPFSPIDLKTKVAVGNFSTPKKSSDFK
jgi:hypothetical protein